MFACEYDGCTDDSSSTEGSDAEIDTNNVEEFEKKMKCELLSDVSSYSSHYLNPATTSKLQNKKELFYDSAEDDANEEFIKELQKSSQGGELHSGKTDAILNCPGCMSLLSLNCQRHSKYKTQYRTMFTFNCKVEDECPPASSDFTSIDFVRNHDVENSDGQSNFKRVLCEICNTPVGLLDSSNVYHLFGVLASHT